MVDFKYDKDINYYEQCPMLKAEIVEVRKNHNIINIIKDSIDEWVDLLLKAKQNAAALSQGDISLGDYQGVADYSFGDIVKSILGFEEVDE